MKGLSRLVTFQILKDEFKILKLTSNKFHRPTIDTTDNNYWHYN